MHANRAVPHIVAPQLILNNILGRKAKRLFNKNPEENNGRMVYPSQALRDK
jgi:hypothetical protein